MRICVVGLRGMPDVMGGVETHCAELLPRVSQRMRRGRVDAIVRARYQKQRTSYEGVALHLLWSPRHKALEAITHTLLGVVYARFAVRPDILHMHAIGPALLAPLARALGMRVVVTHHGRDYERAKWKTAARLALRLGEYCAMICADRVIVVSPSAARSLKSHFQRRAHKITYIPNGAPGALEAGDVSIFDTLGVEPRHYVLSVGRLVPEKGFDDLIAAFQATRIGCKLVIAGAADHDDAYVRALLRKGCERVIFAGFQPRAALAALYRSAALFVLPSRHEGLPLAALEALAAGAPVLLSDIEAHMDIGLAQHHYFQTGDRRALAAKFAAPFDGYRNARPDLLENYNWSRIAAQTLDVYSAVLGRTC